MSKLRITAAFAVLMSACSIRTAPPAASTSPPLPARPATTQNPAGDSLHSVEIADPYRWLEDQEAPATREWIERQNAYTDQVLAARPEARRFQERLADLQSTETVTTPRVAGGRYLFMRRAAGEDLFSIYMRHGRHGADQLLVDPAALSSDHTVSVGLTGLTSASPDGTRVVYFVRRGGVDDVDYHFLDPETRREIGEPIVRARAAWFGPHDRVYFTRVTPDGPRVYRRSLSGGDVEDVFGSGYGPEKLIFCYPSEDGKRVVFQVAHGARGRTDLYLKDLVIDAPIVTIVDGLDARSTARVAGDRIVIDTNWNAPNGRVMVASVSAPAPENWTEIVPENPRAAIREVALAAGRVYVSYLENVRPRVVGFDLTGRRRDEIAFDVIGAVSEIRGTWSAPHAFFAFSSFAVAPTIYEYDVKRARRTIFGRRTVRVNPRAFVVEQVWFRSTDGTDVPMFLFHRKGLRRNGAAPTLLTAYGGFGLSQLPYFDPAAVAWAEQGGVYAVASVRGGGEFGEKWHQAGMRENKQQAFDDFIAAGEYLIRERYTSSRHLGVVGGSNGGLLVTALVTQRPALVGAALVRYPLIDMLRYHKFLMGSFWIPEYGNPDDPEQFRWLHAYSPYHHVKPGQKYPAMLFVTGDADTRVAPLHARKMTALMQALADPSEPVLLRYHVSSGHSGGEPLQVQVDNRAEELGFLWAQLH